MRSTLSILKLLVKFIGQKLFDPSTSFGVACGSCSWKCQKLRHQGRIAVLSEASGLLRAQMAMRLFYTVLAPALLRKVLFSTKWTSPLVVISYLDWPLV